MTPTEHSSKAPHSTGRFAVLSGLLRGRGSGVSRTGRSLGLVPLLSVGVLAFVASPALAQEVRLYSSINEAEPPPVVSTRQPTAVSGASATLTGAWLPLSNINVTVCVFEYRTEAEPVYGQHSIACSPPPPYLDFNQEKQVEATLGVLPNTTYRYRLVLTDASGTSFYGGEQAFTTTVGPPQISNVSAEVDQTEKAGQTNAKLSAIIALDSPAGDETTYHFEYGETTSYGTSIPLAPGAIGSGDQSVPVTAELSGLKIGTTYHYRVVASNELGLTESLDQTFTTLPAALIEESASDVAATSATLNAKVNPLGASTTCESFQYVSDASFRSTGYDTATSVSCLPAALGSGESDVEVDPRHIDGLTPNTLYHYRLLATNTLGTAAPESTFTTQAPGGFSLPDGRQWEMVSPVDSHGALFERLSGGGSSLSPIQASSTGDAITVSASQPSEAEPSGYENGTAVLLTRTSSGWSSQVIASPHDEPAGPEPGGEGPEYRLFSEDLSHAIVQPRGATLMSPEASEQTAYLRTDYLNGNVAEHCESSYLSLSSCFQPLVSDREGYANDTAKPFEPFGEEAEAKKECETPPGRGTFEHIICGPFFRGATPDLSQVLLTSRARLTATAPEHGGQYGYLYEWSGGQLQYVGVPPAGQQGSLNPVLSAKPAPYAISADGSRVILSGPPTVAGPTSLYLRDVVKGETVRLSQGEATFQGANSDDSRVFFIEGGDLYEFEVTSGEDQPLAGRTVDLTSTSREPPEVREVLGASENGSYVYFAAAGALAAGAAHSNCTVTAGAEAGVCNLYVRHDGVTTLIAPRGVGPTSNARVSSDGRYLAFMSNRDLAGDDTDDANSGQPDLEVYLYHTPENLEKESGTLVCASCDSSGARPVGTQAEEDPAGIGEWGREWVASGVPEWEETGGGVPRAYQPRFLSDSGRLFFDSNDALVPRDVNGTWDVYEYEPEGVPEGPHACSPASTSGSDVFEPAHAFEVEGRKGETGAGCVALLSSGTSPAESSFLDASETGGEGPHGEELEEGGGDVFFLTESKLVAGDVETSPVVYDAHECTTQSPCPLVQAVPPPECNTEASCKAAPTPQPSIYGAPSSATFFGPGNLAPPPVTPPSKVTKKTVKCKRDFVKNKRGKCVESKKAKRSKNAKKASYDRRASR